jgi:hypothetical protein
MISIGGRATHSKFMRRFVIAALVILFLICRPVILSDGPLAGSFFYLPIIDRIESSTAVVTTCIYPDLGVDFTPATTLRRLL